MDLYERYGDFAVGYTLGYTWSEAAQSALGSTLQGEARVLVDDCLTGAWVADIIPDATATPCGGAVVEPGDLDEAIQTALVVGDESSTDDVFGSGFEKIASFREGVLDGLDACTPARRLTAPSHLDDAALDHARRRAPLRSTSAPTASTSSSPARRATAAETLTREKESCGSATAVAT